MRERAVRTRREPLGARRCTYGMVRPHSSCVVPFDHAGSNGRPRPPFTNREETIMASTQQSSRKSVCKEVATIGLDLAKTTVHFVGLDATGCVLTRRQYSKGKLLEVTAKMGPCRIGMEGLLRRPSPGTQAAGTGARREADAPQICEALCQARQERLQRRRGLSAPDDALRGGQERAATVGCSRCTAIARGWWATPRN